MEATVCQSQGLNRVFGSEHEVTCKTVERTGFNEEEVKTLLSPAGLWERMLSFDESRLKQLLADTEVPQAVRDSLAALRRVLSTYPQLRLKKRTEEEK